MRLIHELIKNSAQKYGDNTAVLDDYSGYSVTYNKLFRDIQKAASALQRLGIEKGMHISQFSENSSKWLVLDQALLSCGAANAVRGSNAPIDELKYIYDQSDSIALITDNTRVINGLQDFITEENTKFIIYIGNETTNKTLKSSIPVISFDELLEMGNENEFSPVEIDENDLATLIYSSGTTGCPKGIMLSHKNIASQINNLPPAIGIQEKKTTLAVLPIWHAYERTCEYYTFSVGTRCCYTNIKNFKKDLKKYKPHYLIAVPRIWEAIYESVFSEIKKESFTLRTVVNFFLSSSLKMNFEQRILNGSCIYNQNPSIFKRMKSFCVAKSLNPVHSLGQQLVYSKFHKAMGGRFIKGISGGGALAAHIDDFFMSVGLNVVVGYGLTETAPVLAVRTDSDNKAYTTGPAIPETELVIANPETYEHLPIGRKGVVLARGPQIMKGYYKDETNTQKVILPDGFFVTGDIGWLTKDGSLILTGRSKDIIVLSNGENIEPESIEQSCMSSPFVKQIVLAGQDKNSLSALVVPNIEAIQELAEKKKIAAQNPLKNVDVKNEVLKELRKRVQERKTFRSHERISNIEFVEEAFTPENGLMTLTAKIKKNEVYEKYKTEIDAMYR